MNKQRRNALNAIQDRITALQGALADFTADGESIAEDLETLRDEEQEAFDNLSEGLQAAERGQDMEEAVSRMTEALEQIQALIDLDESVLHEAFAAIEDAKGAA